MARIQQNFYHPKYQGFLPCCGAEITFQVKDTYPTEIERVSCKPCGREFNLKFSPNDHGVMVLEIREITA